MKNYTVIVLDSGEGYPNLEQECVAKRQTVTARSPFYAMRKAVRNDVTERARELYEQIDKDFIEMDVNETTETFVKSGAGVWTASRDDLTYVAIEAT